jgi:hypothetical protein
MSKHTPGELYVDDDGDVSFKSNTITVAFIAYPDGENDDYLLNMEDARAYAHLFAAAPELLKAAKAVLGFAGRTRLAQLEEFRGLRDAVRGAETT